MLNKVGSRFTGMLGGKVVPGKSGLLCLLSLTLCLVVPDISGVFHDVQELEKAAAEEKKKTDPAPQVEEVVVETAPVVKEPVVVPIPQPIRKDRPVVLSRPDLISPVKTIPTARVQWRSEYKSKFDSPEKTSAAAVPSAFGKRVHPYKGQVGPPK
eukprot:sb/3473232/